MTTTPHDALVRRTFSQIEHAAGLLRVMLPPAIAARLDLATLALCDGSFVDRLLGHGHTDLLFSVNVAGQKALIYVLFEHQSSVDALMPFRLLQYMVRIWERHHQAHPQSKRFPPIVPVVLHHSRSGWSASTTFEGLLDVDEATLEALGEHTVRLRFVLDDLSKATDESLEARAMSALGRVVLWCLRHAREPDELIQRLRGVHDLLAEVRRTSAGREALQMIWAYILAVHENKPQNNPEEVMAQLMEAAGDEAKEEFVSMADWLREQGREQGERKILLKQLRLRFGEIEEAVAERVRAAGVEQVERWAELVLTARTLEEALGKS
jgi:predicted transposase/invertase (TIGR01784 family)